MIEYIVVGGMVYCGYQLVVTGKEHAALKKEGKRLARLHDMVESVSDQADFFPELLKAIKKDVAENPSLYKGNIPQMDKKNSFSKPIEHIKINYSFSL